MDDTIRNIAFKLRKYREAKGLSREAFCAGLELNPEYWGAVERGQQAISLPKLLQVCEYYKIPIESLIEINTPITETQKEFLRKEINSLLERCTEKQLLTVKKFIEDIALLI